MPSQSLSVYIYVSFTMCREPLCNRWTRDTVREYYEECWTTVLAAVALLVGTAYGTAFVEGASLLHLCFCIGARLRLWGLVGWKNSFFCFLLGMGGVCFVRGSRPPGWCDYMLPYRLQVGTRSSPATTSTSYCRFASRRSATRPMNRLCQAHCVHCSASALQR
jgi:hypothetical protein